MPAGKPLPWVLLRKGSPPLNFATLQLGQRFYNSLCYGQDGWRQPEGTVRGPNGEAWHRQGRHGSWFRDDARHRVDLLTPAEADDVGPEDAA